MIRQSHSFFSVLVLSISLSAISSTALATLNIQILNTTIPIGGTGFVDVEISGGGDLLQSGSFSFQISPVLPVSTSMRFVSPQPDAQLSSPNYLFAGDSFDTNFALPVGTVSTNVLPNDTFNGSESTFSGTDVAVGGTRLLARLLLQSTDPGMSLVTGDQFQVSLTAATFLDSGLNVQNFITSPGTATVGAAAVPEPNSVVLLLLGASAVAFRRSRNSNTDPNRRGTHR